MTLSNVPTYFEKEVKAISQNPLRQNNILKVHTPYPRGHWKKKSGDQTKAKINASRCKVTSVSK